MLPGVLVGCAILMGCAKRAGDEVVSTSAPPIAEASAPENAAASPSNAGTYHVSYVTHPSPIPMNEPFAIEFWVESAAGTALGDSLHVEVDGRMPHHHHGMYRVPIVQKLGPGHYQADGMLFHMPGYWEIYFDIRHEGVTERAQFSVEID